MSVSIIDSIISVILVKTSEKATKEGLNMKKKSKHNKNEITNMQSRDIDPMIDTDPLGSWTGVPDDPMEKPIQDADDL